SSRTPGSAPTRNLRSNSKSPKPVSLMGRDYRGRRGERRAHAVRAARVERAGTERRRPRHRVPGPSVCGPGSALLKSERADVLRLGALGALRDVELDLLVLVERAVPARGDGRVVGEDVRATVVGGDEAEALVSVEPLHGTCSHCVLLPEHSNSPADRAL